MIADTHSQPDRRTIRLFGMTVDALTMPEAVATVAVWAAAPRGPSCRYVVTPNVDHAVMFQTNEKLRAAYADASLVLADGAPVVVASRLLRRAPLPERVPGSDLAPALFKHASASTSASRGPLRVFLLGAAPGVADRAAARIEAAWPGVEVVGTLSPPMGFEHNPQENERIFEAVAAARPDLVLLGFGAPKQELWVHAHAGRLEAKAACALAPRLTFWLEKRRTPRWMRRVGLEWLHRLATEPRRLAKRYLRDAWIFPRLVWRELAGMLSDPA